MNSTWRKAWILLVLTTVSYFTRRWESCDHCKMIIVLMLSLSEGSLITSVWNPDQKWLYPILINSLFHTSWTSSCNLIHPTPSSSASGTSVPREMLLLHSLVSSQNTPLVLAINKMCWFPKYMTPMALSSWGCSFYWHPLNIEMAGKVVFSQLTICISNWWFIHLPHCVMNLFPNYLRHTMAPSDDHLLHHSYLHFILSSFLGLIASLFSISFCLSRQSSLTSLNTMNSTSTLFCNHTMDVL